MKQIESSLEWLLKLIEWHYWVTLTWSPDLHWNATPTIRSRHVRRWITRWAVDFQTQLSDLPLVLVFEKFETNPNLPEHCHGLITFPNHRISATSAKIHEWMWRHKPDCGHGIHDSPCRYGTAHVRPCAPSDVRYMSEKNLEYAMRDTYEFRKFGRSRQESSMISEAAWRALYKARGVDYVCLNNTRSGLL